MEDAAAKSNTETVTKPSRGARSGDFLLIFFVFFFLPLLGAEVYGRNSGGPGKYFALLVLLDFILFFWQGMKETGTQTAWLVGCWSRNQPGQRAAALMGRENT